MISYTTEGTKMPDIKRRSITAWIKEIAKAHGKVVGDIAYIFCNDDKILEINREYLEHDYYTDIITFDYTEENIIGGDIFISLDTVRSNSELLGLPYEQELHRVIIHGVLHLCGIDDKAEGARAVMEAEENKALAKYPNL
ncbi:MAG: rRNA maturation RNase YbeY [Bacteroidaceae bacterium]|nr:rRNA maturation RNase YbeY [Bacteroidaceae bacterium]